MKNDEKDILLDHDYDGIQELDNSLPRWWLIGFYLSVVFAVLYFLYYHMGDGPSLVDQLRTDVAAVEARFLKNQKSLQLDAKKLVAYAQDPAKVTTGHGAFKARCASCHGEKGEGGIGPNLTDNFWINGDGNLMAIATVVRDGVPAKGMPTWGALLSEDEIYTLSAFVKTLKGTNPPKGKAPQGLEVKN